MKKHQLFLSILVLFGNIQFSNAGLLKANILVSEGYSRTYDLYIPTKQLTTASPLVILLHGHMGNADTITGQNNKKAPFKAWLSIAEREGIVLLIPDGEFGSDKYRGWNDCRKDSQTNPKTNDTQFIMSLIEQVSKEHSIDSNKIYVNGMSNGGMMALRLAQEQGQSIKAVAAISAAMPKINKCLKPSHAVSVLIMNGTADPILPYNGGRLGKRESQKKLRGSALSTSESIDYWLRVNKINSKALIKRLPDNNKKDYSVIWTNNYTGGINNSKVSLYRVQGGGHATPSITEHYRRFYTFIVGKQNKDIEMAEEVWNFFKSLN